MCDGIFYPSLCRSENGCTWDSMDTTLSDGQNLIMDKLSYRFRNPERYDIVIFPGPEEYGEHPYYIKRVIMGCLERRYR